MIQVNMHPIPPVVFSKSRLLKSRLWVVPCPNRVEHVDVANAVPAAPGAGVDVEHALAEADVVQFGVASAVNAVALIIVPVNLCKTAVFDTCCSAVFISRDAWMNVSFLQKVNLRS